MPNRVLREGIRHSEAVNSLSDRAYRLYSNLLVATDDWGLCEWSAAWLKANCLPLQPWTLAEFPKFMAEIERATSEGREHGLVRTWRASGKTYAAITTWNQRRFANRPKCPLPPWGEEHITGGYIDPRTRTAASEPTPAAARGNGADHAPAAQPVESIPLKDGTEFQVSAAFAAELERLYPRFDVPGTLGQIRGWAIGKRESGAQADLWTRRGAGTGITSWFAREEAKYAETDPAG